MGINTYYPSTISTDIGASFPRGPSINQIFFRSDRGLSYYYDGTRWLSVNQYKVSMVPTPADASVPSATSPAIVYRHPDDFNFDIYISQFEVLTFHTASPMSTNYWTIDIIPVNTSNSNLTSLGSFSTNGDTTGVWALHTVTVNAVLDSSAGHITIKQTKTSAPNAIYIQPIIVYRLVG